MWFCVGCFGDAAGYGCFEDNRALSALRIIVESCWVGLGKVVTSCIWMAEQVHLETVLLLALKEVVDSKLRMEIREALMMRHVDGKDGEKSGLTNELDEEEEVAPELERPHIAERLEKIGEEVRGRELNAETMDKALKKLLEIQEKLKKERASLE